MAIILMTHSTANTNGVMTTKESMFQLQKGRSCCIQVIRVQNHWFRLQKEGIISSTASIPLTDRVELEKDCSPDGRLDRWWWPWQLLPPSQRETAEGNTQGKQLGCAWQRNKLQRGLWISWHSNNLRVEWMWKTRNQWMSFSKKMVQRCRTWYLYPWVCAGNSEAGL